MQGLTVQSLTPFPSSVIGALCRVTGIIAALLIARFVLRWGLASSLPLALLQVTLACTVGVLVGNIVKECAFSLGELAMNRLGRPFFRITRTLLGQVVFETHLPDGTWTRCETSRHGAVYEWTELDGSCTRVEGSSGHVLRATPPRSLKTMDAHGPNPSAWETR